MFDDDHDGKQNASQCNRRVGIEQKTIEQQHGKGDDGLETIWRNDEDEGEEDKGDGQHADGGILRIDRRQNAKGRSDGFSAFAAKKRGKGMAENRADHHESEERALRATIAPSEIDGQASL